MLPTKLILFCILFDVWLPWMKYPNKIVRWAEQINKQCCNWQKVNHKEKPKIDKLFSNHSPITCHQMLNIFSSDARYFYLVLGTTHWYRRPWTSQSKRGWRKPMMSLWSKKKTMRLMQTMISDTVLNITHGYNAGI